MRRFHVPVMLKEAIDGLNVREGKCYIDATVGGGGQASEILRLGGVLLGIDIDREALEFTRQKLEEGNWKLVQGNFRDIEKIAKENGFFKVEGILFDLGVSSHQLDTPERGFSYRFTAAPLDLRFDQTSGETAAQLVNRLGEGELYDILATFGEEQLAGPTARAIVRARAVKPITTVGDLVRVVSQVVRRPESATLSRVFQALRIAVNHEIDNLKAGLEGAQKLLAAGGRLVVISFHSLEDRIVKQFFQRSGWQVITTKPIRATLAEIKVNVRARSAKLRIGQKI